MEADKLTERQAKHLQMVLSEQHMTQKELCDELGFSPTTVNRWVKGKARIRLDSAKLIHERWPEYEVEWLQGAPDRRELQDLLLQSISKWSASFNKANDAVQTLIEYGGCSVELIENGHDINRVLPDGKTELISKGHDVKLSAKGNECLLTGKQWDYLREELVAYTEMRVNHLLERGCW